jgi:hypothetical protein
VNSVLVSPISQVSANSSAMRSTSASPMPSCRTRLRCAGFTFCDRIATSRTLVDAEDDLHDRQADQADQAFGENRASKSSTAGS